MTHSINLDYDNVTNPNGTIMCDGCNATATVDESADGNWEFMYNHQFALRTVLCPVCNEARLAALFEERKAARLAAKMQE